MTIGGISGSYQPYMYAGSSGTVRQTQEDIGRTQDSQNEKMQGADGSHKVKGGYKSSPADCQTCKERKY